MKSQNKPKMATKSTKVVVKSSGKMPVKKVAIKTTKAVAKPKSQEPNYKGLRMGVNNDNRASGQMFETKPTKADSASYKFGYKLGLAGKGANPSETNTVKMGRWEGQNAKPKVASKKK
jgi:hypothetical protein